MLDSEIKLQPFQRKFLAGVFDPGIKKAALSLPRGNGKSWICARIVKDALTPGGTFWEPGAENVLLSGSFDQARFVYNFARAMLPAEDYAVTDNKQTMSIRHKATGTRLMVRSSRAKGAFGIVGARIAIADEPGAFDLTGGSMMADALDSAIGKPGQDLTVIYIGTLAPSGTEGHWWHDLIKRGSHGSTFVMSLQADAKLWDHWPEIKRVNPLVAVSKEFRATLREELAEARADSRLKARYLSYRLNVPSGDESSMILTVDDWERSISREVAARHGKPIVGIDLGAGRAWSAAFAIWQSGRVEALAVAPGIPSIEAQEKRDRVSKGVYSRLIAEGSLRIAEGLRVQPPAALWAAIVEAWGTPGSILCDRFRLPEMLDILPRRIPVIPRISRWSESSFDIRALRKIARDGPLSIAENSRALLQASLSVAEAKTDDSGNVRLVKKGKNNCSRDDVVAAACLGAGAFQRAGAAPPKRAYLGVA